MCSEHSHYLTQGLFNNEVVVSYNENEEQNGHQQAAVHRQDLTADQVLTLGAAAQRASYTHAGPEKHPNPASKYGFY